LALILNIDTATEAGSVCLARDGVALDSRTSGTQKDHAAVLAPFIRDLAGHCSVSLEQLDAVAVSAGPGSYTGLRVAVSTAKGLCYALGIPLIAVGTLRIMASAMKTLLSVEDEPAADLLYCPLLDARRSDVYGALYESSGKAVTEPAAFTVDAHFMERWRMQPLVLFGSGAPKTERLCDAPAAWRFRPFSCHASWLAPLAEEAFRRGQFCNLAYFEPLYVKPFFTPGPKSRP
jgi:tRNA threonylcarbamoyladenosine biosynthesis protein TsaB